MAAGEDQRGGIHLDGESVDLAGRHERRFLQGVAVAGADDAVFDVEGDAGWKVGARGIDVHQLGGEIGVHDARRRPELDQQAAGHLDVGVERSGCEGQDIIARGKRCQRLLHPLQGNSE